MTFTDAPDWLQTQPVGAAALLNGVTVNVGAGLTVSTPFVVCLGFESLYLVVGADAANTITWTWEFQTRQGITVTLDLQQSWFKVAGGTPTQVVIPVMGQTFRLTAHNTGAGAAAPAVSVYGVAQGAGAGLIVPRMAVSRQNILLAGGAFDVVVPPVQTPGRYRAWINSTTETGALFINRWNGTGYDFAQVVNQAVNANLVVDLVAPMDDVEYQIQNTSGVAASYFWTVVGPY